jgi:uncharacterized membrane protein HdeD (DUF308 family)
MTSDDTNANIERMAERMMISIRGHWKMFLLEGIVLTILGILAVIVPVIASFALAIFFGWLFLVGGLVGLFTTFMMRRLPGFWWSLLSALLAIAVGLALIASPIGAVFSLTIVLAAFFLVEGFASIMYALEHRREMTGRWSWMLASGIVDLILGIIILAGLPGTALWALGLLLGINMIFGGTALIAMALHARSGDVAAPGAAA